MEIAWVLGTRRGLVGVGLRGMVAVEACGADGTVPGCGFIRRRFAAGGLSHLCQDTRPLCAQTRAFISWWNRLTRCQRSPPGQQFVSEFAAR